MILLLAVGLVACGGGTSPPTVGDVTFWQDVAPIYNDKCVRCHQEGGIAPFRLDNYADAQANAALEKQRTAAGTMPPYFMVHDGSCQSFVEDATLTDNQKAIIAAWVDQGAPEGTPVTLTLPPQPELAGAVDVTTPLFAPVAQGGQEAEFDEYRCFAIDPPVTADSFLTGYAVTPGDASIVHHVITFVVDPQAPGQDGRTNGAIMQALDDGVARSPRLAVLRRRRGQRGRVGRARDLGARSGHRRVPDRDGRADQDDRQAGHPDPLQPRRPRLGRQDRQHRRPPALREQRQPRDPRSRCPTACSTRSARRRPTRWRRGRPTSRTHGCGAGATSGCPAARPSIWSASCRTCTGAAFARR